MVKYAHARTPTIIIYHLLFFSTPKTTFLCNGSEQNVCRRDIAEYNPFHKGHLYQLEHTRRAFPGKGVVIVMSGNFVQRGELAIANKHARAKCALLCGADVVFELPVPFVLSPAERFGAAGVALLQATGVCDVCRLAASAGMLSL